LQFERTDSSYDVLAAQLMKIFKNSGNSDSYDTETAKLKKILNK